MKIFLSILSLFLTTNFISLNSVESEKNEIIGFWIYSKYENGINKLIKSKMFHNNKSGIEFKENGKLITRMISGGCATPPITYGNFNGNWQFLSDSTLTIRYDFWGGKIGEDWTLLSIDSDTLKIRTTDYRIERFKR